MQEYLAVERRSLVMAGNAVATMAWSRATVNIEEHSAKTIMASRVLEREIVRGSSMLSGCNCVSAGGAGTAIASS